MGRKNEKKYLTQYEEDCVWMSYRYCIGRSTIAAHMHAGDIANNCYSRLTDARMQFMSEDINNEIYNRIHFNNFIDMGWYGNIPKKYFRPLDVIYSILDIERIDSYEKIRSIRSIDIDWNSEKEGFEHSIYYFNENDKKKDYLRSFSDLSDLEVWQRLANLFDKENHKKCRMIDDSVVEYYEFWRHYHKDGQLRFEKIRTPIDCYQNFSVYKYIPDENIKEDNII